MLLVLCRHCHRVLPTSAVVQHALLCHEQEFGMTQVKDALTTAVIEYEEIELSGQLTLLESIKKTTGRTTVPQVPC